MTETAPSDVPTEAGSPARYIETRSCVRQREQLPVLAATAARVEEEHCGDA